MPIKHTAHPKDERQIYEAPSLGCGEVSMEGLKFFSIPIGEEPRDDIGSDTVQKNHVPNRRLNVESHALSPLTVLYVCC